VVNTLYEELAKIVVKDSLGINSSDVVTITTWDHTIDVANAMAVECFKQGTDAMISLWTDEYYYGLLRESSAESLQVPSKNVKHSPKQRQQQSTRMIRKILTA